MIRGMRIHANGGPDELRWEEFELPPPDGGQVRIRHTAIALNYSDINLRRGGFYLATPLRFPVVLGNEAAGVIESVGSDVVDFRSGDRVAYVGSDGPFYENTGAYAEQRKIPANCLINLPDDISDRKAAALMLKGLTASMVINRIFRPKPGDTILIHAAASGVGLLLCQWSKHLGATVIGTVESAEKAALARVHGCDHAVLYRETDFVAAVNELAPSGVSAVFDGVGLDTFERSFDCAAPFAMLVNYGNASGHVPPIDLILLAKKGSLSILRLAFSTHISDPDEACNASDELFDLVRRGILKVETGQTYRLSDAASAHRDLEARKTMGSVLLLP